jgi:hypothetical protein
MEWGRGVEKTPDLQAGDESACLETQERKNKQKKKDIKHECNGTISTGVKIPPYRSALYEENGKCGAVKHRAEFPTIGNHSPEQHVNQKWP